MRITIRMKLMCTFVFLAILAGVVGYVGITKIHEIDNADTKLFEKMTLPLQYLGKINGEVSNIGVIIRDMVLIAKMPEIKKTLEEKITAKIKSSFEGLKLYESTFLSKEDEADHSKLVNLCQEFFKKVETVTKLELSGKESEAVEMLGSEDFQKAFENINNQLGAMLEANAKAAKDTSDTNTVLANAADVTMKYIILGAIILSLILGFVISSQIYSVINCLIAEAGRITDEIRNGNSSARGEVGSVNFEFAGIVMGVNEIMDAMSAPLKLAANYIQNVSNVNDIPAKITEEYKGDFNVMKNNINTFTDVLALLKGDLEALAKASSAGDLKHRIDAARHHGFFRGVMTGVNNTIDSIVNPLNIAADYVEKISQGNIPTKITEAYNGDFNKIKNNLNACIEAVGLLVSDTKGLATSAVEGKLSTRADASKHQGDFQKIVDGINKTLDAVIKPVEEASECLVEMASGNLNVAVKGDYKGDHAKIKDALNQTIDAMNEILSQVNVAVSQVDSGSRQVSDASQSLSQSSTETASSLEEISATMQEINAQTKQNAANATQANSLAGEARGAAEHGNSKMGDMRRAMNEINEAAANVSRIIKAIDEIAFQTNLLALNAAVEAARAGKHGKGFTVVAEEVRNLAQRSAKAAKETAEMIAGSIKKTEAGLKIAEDTAESLGAIVDGATKVGDLIAEIAAAAREQEKAVTQVNQGLTQIDQGTQQNTATAEEAASASEELSSQAAELKNMLTKFNLKNSSGTVNAYVSENRFAARGRTVKKIESSPVKNKDAKVPAPIAVAAGRKMVKADDIISLDDSEFGKF